MFEQIAADEEHLAIVCFSLVAIVTILVFGGGWTIVNILRINAHTRLKMQMLDRGMNSTEMERVLMAGVDDFKTPWHEKKSPPVRKPAPAPPA